MGLGDRLGGAYVEISADAAAFYKTLNTLDDKSADSAKDVARTFLKTLDAHLKAHELEPNFGMDTSKARAEYEKFAKTIQDLDVNVDLDASRLEEIKVRATAVVTSIQDLDQEAKINAKVSEEAKEHVKKTLDDIAEKRKAHFEAETNAGANKATTGVLAYLGRARTVEYYPIVKDAAAAKVATMLKALSGTRMLKEQTQRVYDMVKNLDKAIPRVSKLATMFTLVGNGITSLVSNASALLYNIGQIAGVSLALPGIFAGMGIGLAATVIGFKDITNQIPEVRDKLADLSTNMSAGFWANGLTGIQTFIDTVFEDFSSGLVKTSGVVGAFFGAFGTSLSTALDSSKINSMFDYLNQSIAISTKSTDDFANIIAILGENGASYLPRLAQWFSDISSKFSNWLTDAENTGRITEIIDTGISRAAALGNAVLSIGTIIARVGKIAEESGAVSLESMAASLDSVADKIDSEPFKSRLTEVFTSAHTAMDIITSKSGPAFSSMMDSLSSTFADALTTMAPAVGSLLDNLFTALDSSKLQAGFTEMIQGVADGISGFSEYLPGIADGLGSLMKLIGTLSSTLMPLLGNWLEKLATLAQILEPALSAVASVLGFVMNKLTMVINPITLFGAGVAGLIATFSGFTAPAMTLALGLEKIGTSALLGSTKLGSFSKIASNALLGVSAAGSATASTIGTTVASGFTKLSSVGSVATVASKGLSVALTALPWVAVGAAAVGAAVGVYKYSQKVRYAKVDTEAAATELTALGEDADITGTQLDKLLSTGWGPWREEINTTTEAFEAFGKTAKAAGSDYANDVAQLDETLSNMINAGDVEGAMELYEGFATGVRNAGGDVGQFADDMSLTNEALANHGDKLDSATDSVFNQAKAQEELNIQTQTGTKAITEQAGAYSDYAEKVASSNEGLLTAHDNIRTFYDSLDEIKDKFTATADEAAEWNKPFESLLNVPVEEFYDKWVTASTSGTEAQRDAGNSLEDLVQDSLTAISSMKDMAASNEEIRGSYDEHRSKILELAAAYGLTEEQMEAVLTQMGLLSSAEVSDSMLNVDTQVIDGLVYQVQQLTNGNWVVTIDGNTVDASQSLESLGVKAKELKDGTYEFTFMGKTVITDDPNLLVQDFMNAAQSSADGEPVDISTKVEIEKAKSDLDRLRAENSGLDITWNIDADTGVAEGAVDSFKFGVTNSPVFLGIDGNPTWAYQSLAETKYNIGTTTGTMKLDSQATSKHYAAVAGAQSTINNTHGVAKIDGQKTAVFTSAITSAKNTGDTTHATIKIDGKNGNFTSTVATLKSGIGSAVMNIIAKVRGIGSANGNIFLPYANGGSYYENHIAQISRGATRIWSEPETGGEIYIPLAKSKRTRSQKIYQQAAEMLDMTTPTSISNYANGSKVSGRTIGGISSTGSTDVTVNVYPTNDLNAKQLGRSISRQIAARMP